MTLAGDDARGDGPKVDRLTSTYVNEAGKFVVAKAQFAAQYAQIYFSRLMKLAPVLRSQVASTWPGVSVSKVLCLEDGRESAVVGTLFKEMRLRPSILKEYTSDATLSELLKATRFCDDSDSLVLEDESARIVLGGAVDVAAQVTGTVVAVRGVFDGRTGVFAVSDLLLAGLPRQRPLPSLQEDKFLAIVSGLGVGASGAQSHVLLLDWLKGFLGADDAGEGLCRRVVRLVVAGGSLAGSDNLAAAAPGSKQQRFAMDAVFELDRCMCELAPALPVDVMPGPGDLSNVALPQQPLNRCLFPAACGYASFQRVCNPYECSLDGVHVLGTSGQNVTDIQRYCAEDDVLTVMERNLTQRHLCPTAPDTLPCHPFTDREPFVVEECPHIYFVGNQPRFEHREVRGSAGQRVRLVSVPSFAQTGVLALVNLRTLDCQALTFDTSL